MSAFSESDATDPQTLFDAEWYLKQNPDVAQAGIDPFEHYMTHGWREGRDPHPLFDTSFYLENNPDVAAAGENPLVHYFLYGRSENRRAFSCAPEVGKISSICLESTYSTLLQFIKDHYPDPAVTNVASIFSIINKFDKIQEAFAGSLEAKQLLNEISKSTRSNVGEVDVSIIIPVHNALLYTLTCIASIVSAQTNRTYEIIVGDDKSTDGTADLIGGLGKSIKYIENKSQLGFLRNCNNAAHNAVGRYLIFLNNDTVPLPGWLDRLVETVEQLENVGVVGARLLNGDGSLQEAGGIVWSDGSAWNYGRNSSPNLPEFNYLKDVDYCSGAVLLVPALVWRRLGGFDSLYEPAYCEDSDFFFRARALGYRTVYQPQSCVVHHEGRSHGRDVSSGIKSYQTENQRKFLKRWQATLQKDHFANGDQVFLARDRSQKKSHLLVVDHYVPQWDRDAGSRTMFHFLQAFLDRNFQITFWPDNLYRDPDYTIPLQQLGIEVIYGPEYVDSFETWIIENAKSLDYILLSRPHISIKYISAIRRYSKAKVLYYGHDLHWLRMTKESEATGDLEVLRNAEIFKQWETDIAVLSDAVIYPSKQEAELVGNLIGDRHKAIAVPGWMITESELQIARARINSIEMRATRQLIFVGGFSHGPNVDGILWFLNSVFPLIRREDPAFEIVVVGSNVPAEVAALACEGVNVAGRVSDEMLHELYAKADVAIVPLRYGGGVKGKLIEAFANGVPVVATSVGVQGIDNPELLAFVRDGAADFADAVLEATRNRSLALEHAKNAISYLGNEYTSVSFFKQLGAVLPDAMHWSATQRQLN